MKKLVTALALTTLAASPAFAAKKHPMISPEAAAAQASVPSEQGLPSDPYTVIVNGRIVGRDPDPNVRLMLMRDPIADAS